MGVTRNGERGVCALNSSHTDVGWGVVCEGEHREGNVMDPGGKCRVCIRKGLAEILK